MISHDEVCVLVPTFNEAATITSVVERYREQGFDTILVMDGGSTDGTRELAADAGARVEVQTGDGKGQAVREAVGIIDRPVVLMVDGDSTYRPDEADRMLDPIFDGRAEHVIGNRFADMKPGAMTRLNTFGNGIINRTFRFIHGEDLVDILSGYRAFTTDSFDRLDLGAEGFGIETEMAVECVKHGIATEVVPITYEPRPEESETNLRPVRDGGNIILRLYQMAKTNNPLFYFGSLGVLSALIGLFIAAIVGYRWLVQGISHNVLALAAGVALLFGVQLIMFGVLSDLIVTANRRQNEKLNRIAAQLEVSSPSDTPEFLQDTGDAGESDTADGGESDAGDTAGGGEGDRGDTETTTATED